MPEFDTGAATTVAQKARLRSLFAMRSIRREWLIAIPLLILFASILAKPVPLVGGLTDDYRYLVGAHCLTCLPANHWESRFLIVWPTGIALNLFGSSIWSMMIFPVATSIAAVVLIYKITEREYGTTAGVIAACLLVITPIFGERSMRIGVDVAELALLLGSVFVLQRGLWPGWSGLLVALAALSRPTQLAALPPLLFLAWCLGRRQAVALMMGFVATIVAAMIAYWIAGGDPFLFWELALHHTKIPSWLLSNRVDTTKSPLFNPDFIGGWIPNSGFKAHWSIQGLLNLLLNHDVAVILWTGICLATLRFKSLDTIQKALLISSAFYFAVLTYAFAIDPEPRMFMPIIAAMAVLSGSLIPSLWKGPTKFAVIALLSLNVVFGIIGVHRRNDYSEGAVKAAELVSSGNYELTQRAHERMALMLWNPPSRKGHLIDVDHVCKSEIRNRRLIAFGQDICIYE